MGDRARESPVSSPRPVTLERPGRGAFKLYSRFFLVKLFFAPSLPPAKQTEQQETGETSADWPPLSGPGGMLV